MVTFMIFFIIIIISNAHKRHVDDNSMVCFSVSGSEQRNSSVRLWFESIELKNRLAYAYKLIYDDEEDNQAVSL